MNAHTVNAMAMKNGRDMYVIIGNVSNPGEGILSMVLRIAISGKKLINLSHSQLRFLRRA